MDATAVTDTDANLSVGNKTPEISDSGGVMTQDTQPPLCQVSVTMIVRAM